MDNDQQPLHLWRITGTYKVIYLFEVDEEVVATDEQEAIWEALKLTNLDFSRDTDEEWEDCGPDVLDLGPAE